MNSIDLILNFLSPNPYHQYLASRDSERNMNPHYFHEYNCEHACKLFGEKTRNTSLMIHLKFEVLLFQQTHSFWIVLNCICIFFIKNCNATLDKEKKISNCQEYSYKLLLLLKKFQFTKYFSSFPWNLPLINKCNELKWLNFNLHRNILNYVKWLLLNHILNYSLKWL